MGFRLWKSGFRVWDLGPVGVGVIELFLFVTSRISIIAFPQGSMHPDCIHLHGLLVRNVHQESFFIVLI